MVGFWLKYLYWGKLFEKSNYASEKSSLSDNWLFSHVNIFYSPLNVPFHICTFWSPSQTRSDTTKDYWYISNNFLKNMITLYMPTPKNGQTPGLSQKRCVTQEILLSEETLCYLYCPAPSFNANLNSAHLIMFSLLVLLLPATTYAW